MEFRETETLPIANQEAVSSETYRFRADVVEQLHRCFLEWKKDSLYPEHS